MLDYVSDASGATEGRGAREPASKARGFNSTSEDELASWKSVRRVGRIPTSGLQSIMSRTAGMVKRSILIEKDVLRRYLKELIS